MASNVIDYVLEKYPKTFKNKKILVEENDTCVILYLQTKTNHP